MTVDDQLRELLETYEPPRSTDFDLARAANIAHRRSVRRRMITGGTVGVCLLIVAGAFALIRSSSDGGNNPRLVNIPQRSSFAAALGMESTHASTPLESREHIAHRVADALLAAYTPPPGAQRTATHSSTPPFVPSTPNLVTRAQSWIIPGDANTVVNDLGSHPPTGFESSGIGRETGTAGQTTYNVTFAPTAASSSPLLANIPEGVDGTLQVAAQGAANGKVRLTAYAVVTWRRLRTPAENVSIDVDRLVITHTAGLHDESGVTRTTITDPGTIAHVAKLLDALPPVQPGTRMCPMDDGELYTLAFYRTGQTDAVASATVAATGCRTATISIPGETAHSYDTTTTTGNELEAVLPTLMK